MPIPHDYAERVYAGVLGKIIGVYLGRPVENWSYERIGREIGEVDRYLHERRGMPLVVTDDDISGTFTFLRALPDHGNRRDLTPAEIGATWLNYVIDRRSILWWGGLGNSTEHTAYLRLKRGVPAPESGSIARNGKVVAEQIGAQIFIDGWAMVAPGDPELAADLARRAASVSHDGEAVYGAQVVAAMEALAFVEADLGRLLDAAVGLIPRDSTIFRLIDDVRDWHAGEPDWRATRARIAATYGYDRYHGPCHMVPNHALIILAFLYGEDDFGRSLMIVNTCGWDTDCNSGNVGCLLGIKNGLAGIDGTGGDWRGPVDDRLYLATADGGRGITDAATEAFHVVNVGRALAGLEPVRPKGGARFHFELPGAVQGFRLAEPVAAGTVAVENVVGHSAAGTRSLAVRYQDVPAGQPVCLTTPTFIPPEAAEMPGYTLLASPTLFPGQTVRARVAADAANPAPVAVRLAVQVYGAGDRLVPQPGPGATLPPGASEELTWRLEETGGQPIAAVGLDVVPTAVAGAAATAGVVYLDFLTWEGAPDVTLGRPKDEGVMWQRAWVDGVDHYKLRAKWPEPYRIAQNEGTGLISQGTAEWTDYRVSATVTVALARTAGIAARVGGLRRYYALLLCDGGTARLVKTLDDDTTLAETACEWRLDRPYDLALEVVGSRLRAWVDDRLLFDVVDADRPLTAGGVALVVAEGCLSSEAVRVQPV